VVSDESLAVPQDEDLVALPIAPEFEDLGLSVADPIGAA